MSPPRRSIPITPQPHDSGFETTRRGALQWMAASMALAAGGCGKPPERPIYSYAHTPEIEANGAPIHYATAVLRNGFAQGVLVGTQQGRPIKVEGHPQHPASLGGTDVFAQAEILSLWDPDRSQTVRGPASIDAGIATWDGFAAAWRARPAGGLRVLSGPITSPTLQAQLADLLGRHPSACWHRVEAEPAERVGARLAFGRALQPVARFDRAELIVSFAGDPFSTHAAAVRQAADWARHRTEALANGRDPPRLIAVETTPSLFGGRADERWALAPVEIEAIIQQLADGGAGQHAVAGRLAALLAANAGRVVLCAGPCLSAEAHARVLALNQRFGALGRTVDLIVPPDEDGPLPPPASRDELLADMHAGRVGTLIILDANPSYTMPAALAFDASLARVPFSVHLGMHRDETARRCTWHLPMNHAFETWGDARAFDGTLTPLQPAIAPLYDTRSANELLALLSNDPLTDGHALVRRHWRERFGSDEPGFDALWRRSLRAGQVADTASQPVEVRAAKLPSAVPTPIQPSRLQVIFPRDASVDDGRFASNAWLQELPRPLTKLTWGNALHLGPVTAASLHVTTGDMVRLTGDSGASITAPVWVQRDHAEGAATLPIGYGRRAAGGVGDGIGVDAAPVRGPTEAPVALRMERIDERHVFAVTQVETETPGGELAREVDAQHHPHAVAPLPSLYPKDVPPVGLAAWGMAIDLDACIGCNVCTIACQAENNIPVVGAEQVVKGRAMHWIRVDVDVDANGRSLSQPVPCMHCENAPCEVVCPVGATLHDSEGLNVQVYNRCIGTRFCSNNCPYKVRRFNFLQFADVEGESFKAMRNPDVTVRSRGVMEKCSYCVQRLSRARRDSQKTGQPLADGDVVTACQGACPTKAIHFGDLNDPASDVVRMKASPRHYAMLEELGTRPRTTYLARVKRGGDA